ncbi:protein of unknown function [Candidatus Promineifilum breve]|uniref:Butirosin biosynthesis protein H N-terminal domain-containing protein n=1 Tax=Candidatus Promineifilum breve TaxID=1806508 RepID=A0A170PJT2_9CHLR|nr:BtrH N-terminal domain-containing protein [Candidatus Promineifilum breve]CUS05937.1 protein of unknown function [Candidatus Promineifilum breve]
MTILEAYQQFDGRHWETGSVANYFAYRGLTAPHTGRPYSEALLLGVSGGAVMGYFSFAYEGYDPMARILTRNTFDPWDTMLSRLGVAQNVQHTAKPATAERNLLAALEEGTPALVWADVWGLPYNGLAFDDGMWAMFPVLVYGYDTAADRVLIADRARLGLTTTTGELAAARGRAKNNKHRLMTLEAPDPAKLPAAVAAGIGDCLRLYTEAPPRGSKNNFGLAACHWWAAQLTNPRGRTSWERVFPAGRKMLAGLSSVFTDVALFGLDKGDYAGRKLYADFLDEAAGILSRPGLHSAAGHFRTAAEAWRELTLALLPDAVEPLRLTRELLLRRHHAFLARGNGALDEMKAIDAQLDALMVAAEADFPLSAAEVVAFRQRLAEQVLAVHDVEAGAVAVLKDAMS